MARAMIQKITLLWALCLGSVVWAGDESPLYEAELAEKTCSVQIEVSAIEDVFHATALEAHLIGHPNIEVVDINLNSNMVCIRVAKGYSMDDVTLTALLEEAGYQVRSINYPVLVK